LLPGEKGKAMPKRKLVREEMADGSVYEYVPLGNHVVSAPRVCRGRPTFKYTRIEVAGVLEWLGAGHSVEQLLAGYRGRVPAEALREAAALAGKALVRQVAHQTGGP
jgi:uncharacterized protein (DUF433 family)